MRIKDARPVHTGLTPRGFRTLLRFAFEPIDGVLIYDCALVRCPDGRMLVYGPPSKTDSQILSLAPAVRRDLIELTLREVSIDGPDSAAA